MKELSVFEAKTHLSRFLEELATGKSDGYIITRHGKAIARLTPEPIALQSARIGVAKDQFSVPDSIDERANEAANLFLNR
jgi:antitoxin (DNA-binding transcriptional repressor) of toxin-antitoxin stability system